MLPRRLGSRASGASFETRLRPSFRTRRKGTILRESHLAAGGERPQRKLPSMPTKSWPSALDRLWWQDMQLEGAFWI
jgi:hypothetical protein